MNYDTNRILIETMIRKAIRDIQDSPKRGTRNIIDLALNFADGRFQKHFFSSAQRMLENEQSAYYDSALDLVSHVEPDRIVAFGMNLGYNGCTLGAKKIREIEDRERYNIPWTIPLMIEASGYAAHKCEYHSLVQRGKHLGIYAWQLCVTGDPAVVVPLMEENRDCAFAVFCDPGSVTEEFWDGIRTENHVMPVIRCNAGAPDVCRALRERGFLYSVFMTYTPEDASDILTGEFFLGAEELHPAFTMLVAKDSCPIAVREQVYDAVGNLRAQQTLRAIPWEVTYDASFVDGVISNEPCSVLFDSRGNLHNWNSREEAAPYNIFSDDLAEILKSTQAKQPKSKQEKYSK